VTYAGLGRRALALIVDGVLSLIIAIPVAGATGGIKSRIYSGPSGDVHTLSFQLRGLPLLLTVLFWLFYMTYAEGTRGASVGKRLTGIRVVAVDGSPIDLRMALIRNVVRIVDAIPFYLLGLLFALSSPKRQRLGDRAAGTVVVPADAPARSGAPTSWEARSIPPPPVSVSATPPVPPPPPV
jgi:uncharacterized RDD family membrane protein YckC